MSNENHSQFEDFLAQAAEPEELDGEKVEAVNDPAESLNRGLNTLYKKHLSLIDRQRETGLIDRVKADELANSVLALVKKDGLESEIGYTSTERAKEIIGPEMFFGPNEVRKAVIEIYEGIPPIPFNPDELERAKELGQMLIYRTSTTMKELFPEIKEDGDLPYSSNWYKNEDFYESDMIQPGWVLVSKELIPGSRDRNYLQQSESLAEYLVNEVFKGIPLPMEYQEAIDQLNDQKETIHGLIDCSDDEEKRIAADMLVDLRINQLFGQSPAEVIYDCLVYFQNTGVRLRLYDNVWTNVLDPDILLVSVGDSHEGVSIYSLRPNDCYPNQGVAFSRRK